jgi:hypothetical protein
MSSADTHPVTVRVGIPLPSGQLVRAARDRGYPVLFSANAFAVYDTRGERRGELKNGLPPPRWFQRFRAPPADEFAGLDSAGFTAMAKYGDFPWTVPQYVELAASYPWTWWSAADYCVEAEVAANRAERLLRIAATGYNFFECNREADRLGIKRPMPVLQGWTPEDYRLSAELLPVGETWPDLIGIGSVCRRHINGENGILQVIAALDGIVPPHVKFHLFGVKSAALGKLLGHPRLHSMDSMAWEMDARASARTGRTMAVRIAHMERWSDRQRAIARGPATVRSLSGWGYAHGVYSRLPLRGLSVTENLLLEALAEQYADLVLSGDIDFRSARCHMDREAMIGVTAYRRYGIRCLDTIDDYVPGLSPYVERRLAAVGENGELQLERAA